MTTPWFTIHTFGVLLAAAYLAALVCVVRGARRAALNPEALASLGSTAIIGALIGAKSLMALREYLSGGLLLSDLWSLSFVASAGDFYGGFIGGVVAAAIYLKSHRDLPLWPAADVCAPAIALGQAIGRIGCFMAGDDYGTKSGMPWAVTFTDVEAARIGGAPLNVPLHPVQLYESAACFTLFLILLWISGRKRMEGDVILAYTSAYAAVRFWLENFRGDVDRGFVFAGLFSTSQFIALLMFVLSASLLIYRHASHSGVTICRLPARQ